LHSTFIPFDLGLIDVTRDWSLGDEPWDGVGAAVFEQSYLQLKICSLLKGHAFLVQPLPDHIGPALR
jgi:hypothetical protein